MNHPLNHLALGCSQGISLSLPKPIKARSEAIATIRITNTTTIDAMLPIATSPYSYSESFNSANHSIDSLPVGHRVQSCMAHPFIHCITFDFANFTVITSIGAASFLAIELAIPE